MKFTFSISGLGEKFIIKGGGNNLTPKDKKSYRIQIANQLSKNLIPFHATLISGKQNIIICGASGSGKTTLANSFIKKGYKILANDFLVIWKDKNKILAGDLNLLKINKNRKSVSIDKIVFLSPLDTRDLFKFRKEEAIKYYLESFDKKVTNLTRFTKGDLFENILDKHIVLGNRNTPVRWLRTIQNHKTITKPGKIGIIGLGTVGKEIASLLLTQKWINTLNLFSPNQTKLKGLVLDLKSANPSINIIQHPSSKKLIQNSNLIVLSFKSNSKNNRYKQERMQRLDAHAKIVWGISRILRKKTYKQSLQNQGFYKQSLQNQGFYKGQILVISNPVDILSWALYYFSNLDDNAKLDWKGLLSSQVLGIGLGLDHSRLKTLTKKPYELVGEHGDNILLAKLKGSKLTSVGNKKLLNEVINYSPTIRKHVDRTIYGPAHEAFNVIRILHQGKGIIRASSVNKYDTFSGNILRWNNSLPSFNNVLTPKLNNMLRKKSELNKKYQNLLLDKIKDGT